MNRNLLIHEFLDEIRQRADTRFKGHLHRAFLSWYVEAEFGGDSWNFTDDVRDGGIDAIVWRPDDTPPVVIIQSKFSEHVGGSPPPRHVYRDFHRVVDAFHHRNAGFDALLSAVREDLRRLYRKAFDRLTHLNDWRQERKAFRFVTTRDRRRSGEFDRIPQENFIYADGILRLYEQYRKGATPIAQQLQLTIQDKLVYKDNKHSITSYLFNARLSDFRKYLEQNDVARLVARNIRYNLGGSIGRNIRTTYEKSPLDFWYLHNGLTLICDEFEEKNQIATLINPSIVNGAQTLYAISGSPRRQSSALVTTRVIVRRDSDRQALEDDEWVQKVIRGVNTQNRVHSYDFRSNEPEQVELQKRFRDMKVFYERKRGEWGEVRNDPKYRGHERVSLKTLGQILTVTSEKDGRGVLTMKRGVEAVFEDKNYRRLYPSRARVAHRFERIYLAYRLYSLLDRFGYTSAREHRKQRHAFWNTLWVLHRGVTSARRLHSRVNIQGIREAYDTFERSGVWGRRAKKIVKRTRAAIWSAWRKARMVDPEKWTANNFFKSAYGNRKILSLVLPKVRADLHSLGEYIAKPH